MRGVPAGPCPFSAPSTLRAAAFGPATACDLALPTDAGVRAAVRRSQPAEVFLSEGLEVQDGDGVDRDPLPVLRSDRGDRLVQIGAFFVARTRAATVAQVDDDFPL